MTVPARVMEIKVSGNRQKYRQMILLDHNRVKWRTVDRSGKFNDIKSL